MSDSGQPTEAALLKMLEVQWQDHFQTRTQTWKGLEIAAIVAVAVVGVDWRLDNPRVTVVAAGLLAVVALCGIGITLKHREVERLKFSIINKVEERLGLAPLVPQPKLPKPLSVWSIFSVRQSNNPLFILRMHFVILLFALGYGAFRILDLLTR